jgi:hypothetical protein
MISSLGAQREQHCCCYTFQYSKYKMKSNREEAELEKPTHQKDDKSKKSKGSAGSARSQWFQLGALHIVRQERVKSYANAGKKPRRDKELSVNARQYCEEHYRFN